MALTKGPRGIGHVVWLATRTVRLAGKTGTVTGRSVGHLCETAGRFVACTGYYSTSPPRERQKAPTATG